MKEAAPILSLIKIPVADLPRSVHYYRDVLGFQEEFTVVEYGWSSLSAGTVQMALFVPGMGGGDRQPGGTTGFHLEVTDLDGLHGRLQERGAVLPEGVITGADGSRFLLIQDPDGNLLQVMQAEQA